jgi:glycosyltransferase involved in cell wall biosynthesis
LYYHGSSSWENLNETSNTRKMAECIEGDFSTGIFAYIFPSRMAREHERAPVLDTQIPWHIIPNPVSDEFFSVSGPHKHGMLGCVTRWESVKNVSFLEEIFRYNATVASPYEIRCISDCDAVIKDRLATPHFEFQDPLEKRMLAAFYAECGAIVSPSIYETFGNVPAEAVAAGTPALISKTMGVAEIFTAIGLDRLIVEFSSPAALFDALPKCIEQGISRTEREELRKLLNPDAIHARLVNVLLASAH